MLAVSRSAFLPSLPDSIIQGATELEPNPSVSCLRRLFSVFVDDDLQTQVSGPGFFANAQNILITGGAFVSRFSQINLK